MEHAKKMVVVPQDFIERMREGTGGGGGGGVRPSSLDAEMHRILGDKRLDDTEKWKQYQQVLQRFLHFSAAKRQPVGLSIISEEAEGNAQRESATLLEEVVETFPKIYKTEARSLLRIMTRRGSPITWDANMAVYVNNEMIPDSNIVDIMHAIVRARRVDRLPTGWQQVMTVLKDMNVPKEYVSNPTALRFLGVGLDKASSPWGDTTASSTPLSPRRTPILERLRPTAARRKIITEEPDQESSFDSWEPFTP